MRSECPETPEFWQELEDQLRMRASGRRFNLRLPVSLTALRALKTLNRHLVHSVAVVALAGIMVVGGIEPTGETATVEINLSAPVPGYLAQYSAGGSISPVDHAKASGYEVAVHRMFTTDPALNGQIIAQRQPGELRFDQARGPVLFVIGYTIGDETTLAN